MMMWKLPSILFLFLSPLSAHTHMHTHTHPSARRQPRWKHTEKFSSPLVPCSFVREPEAIFNFSLFFYVHGGFGLEASRNPLQLPLVMSVGWVRGRRIVICARFQFSLSFRVRNEEEKKCILLCHARCQHDIFFFLSIVSSLYIVFCPRISYFLLFGGILNICYILARRKCRFKFFHTIFHINVNYSHAAWG